MKKTAIFMTCCMLIQNISFAYTVRNVDVVSEKIIPFSFISENMPCEQEISIKGLDNVKIEKVYIDNGEIDAYIDGEYIYLDLNDGEKSNSIQTITRTDTIEIENMPLSNENEFIIEVKSDENIKEITEVSGDFQSATISSNGIEIKVNKEAEGISGYDTSKIEKSLIDVKVENDNKLRKIQSEWVDLEHEIVGNVEPVSGDTSAIEDIFIQNNSLKVSFNNGTPKLNETIVNDGHTYFWIDRDAEGIFKKYDPNSIYSTDRNKISGEGEYLDESEKDQLGMLISNNNWLDYCGAEINGVRYIYSFDKEIRDGLNGEILKNDFIEVKGQELNTEKYTVYFSRDGVFYVPEGKLYSMGELVSGTSGWGETTPNHDWESKETFFNEITGKYETYVKHYKFFYGPENKKAFGGFYTYPYSCKLQYEHYKPVNLYSGQVIYTYEAEEYVRGYLYNGWIKISYTENKTVKDYPPTSPYNIKYDSNNKLIAWEHGTDDYTEKDKLSYQMQVYAGSWGNIIPIELGKNSKEYIINYSDFDIRVRTVDEIGQVSEWSYLSDNAIELSGSATPSVIKAGDKINIKADTKSLAKIASVKAKSSDLGIDCELYKLAEEVPEYFEMTYALGADFLNKKDYIYSQDRRYVDSSRGENWSYQFDSGDIAHDKDLEILVPENITFTKNGTIIIPSGNYLPSPINIFEYDGKKLYLHMTNELGIKNKVTAKKETLIAFENATYETYKNYWTIVNFVPRLKINTFNYDSNGNPEYVNVEVDETIANKPIVMRWNTDACGVTRIDISIENKHIYSYEVDYNTIQKYVNNIEYERIEKYIKKYSLTGFGYMYPNKRFTADWARIVVDVIPWFNVSEFPWLGYKVNTNEYVRESYVTNYNNNPEVRNVYRTLILDEYASDAAVKKYINLIKTTNFPIKHGEENTIFADDVLDYSCKFECVDIVTNNEVLPGKYGIELTAIDVDGNSSKILLTVIVENDETQMYPEEEVSEKVSKIKDVLVGRFFYRNGKGYLEEFKKSEKSLDSIGFICAGETIGINFIADNAEFLDIDFIGDEAIKNLDELTKLFLIEKPKANGKNVATVKDEYDVFPKRIYPVSVNLDGESEFKYFYTIPYGTKQNIHSWSTLKNSTLERIDTNKLFNRISPPYKLRITVNGDENNSYEIPFDVFERWDTVINRDVTNFVTNSNTKWEIRIDK